MQVATYWLYAIVFIIGITTGAFIDAKILQRKCPDCNPQLECPQAVELNGFDVDKLNNKKGHFHLHNTLENVTIRIESKDSLLIKQLLRGVK